jgi:hypothetical protein
MFSSFRARELAALAPLLDLARQKTDAERREWIDDLRKDAPVLMARIEAMLAAEEAEPSAPAPASRSVGARRAGGRPDAVSRWPIFLLRPR